MRTLAVDWHSLGDDSSNLQYTTVCIIDCTAGVWRVSLDPVEAGGPYNVTAVCENSTATLTDVLFGDVWLCGGQSNMFFETRRVRSSVCTFGLNISTAHFAVSVMVLYASILVTWQAPFYFVPFRSLIHQKSLSLQQNTLTLEPLWSLKTSVILSWLIYFEWIFPGLCPLQVDHSFIHSVWTKAVGLPMSSK